MNNFAKMIDHTLLKADATRLDIEKLCQEAKQYNMKSVCVNPTWVKFAKEKLQDSSVFVCTVIGFPLGATTSEVKAFETKNAIENGADEIDMVINIGALKNKQYDIVLEDIQKVVEAANNKTVKVIIETALLSNEEKIKACELAVKAGAHFVKTSTGFSKSGATVEDVQLMRKTVGEHVGVKASGGIRSLEDMKKMIEAGATRIGASSGIQILSGLKSEEDY